jgi:phosphoribosylformimino-5-aminoimidazole carboxamide ribotide isomerase
MLIPSIDLQQGRIVQLIQGEQLAIATDDIDLWMGRFSSFPVVQLIDLDAAMGRGDNDALVRRIAAALPCRVGGGVRSIARAQALIEAGAEAVIVGSRLFDASDQGPVDLPFAQALAEAIGEDRWQAAVDAKAGQVVVQGWTSTVPLTPVEAVRILEPWCGGFLYTHVDREGLMQGTDMAAIAAIQAATRRRVTAAGGITTHDEIAALDALGVDAVVGMALYTGRLALDPAQGG